MSNYTIRGIDVTPEDLKNPSRANGLFPPLNPDEMQDLWEQIDQKSKSGQELTQVEHWKHITLPTDIRKRLLWLEQVELSRAKKQSILTGGNSGSRSYKPAGMPAKTKAGPGGLLQGHKNLGDLMESGIEDPDMLLPGRYYRDAIHGIFAPHGVGKTLLALHDAIAVINQHEHVLYLDEENSYRQQVQRLLKMGADQDLVKNYFHWFGGTGLTTDPESLDILKLTVEEYDPSLIVFDSWIDFLGQAGLDENSSTDVAEWTNAVCLPLKNAGRAVLILDHANREGHYRGSSAKPAALDVYNELKLIEGFDRNRVGSVQLRRGTDGKDREGMLPDKLTYTIGGHNGKLICELDGSVEEADDLTVSERKAFAVLAEQQMLEDGIGFNEWFRQSGIKSRTTFNNALSGLRDKGRITKNEGGRYEVSV